MARSTGAAEAVAGETRAELARQRRSNKWLAEQLQITPSTLHRKIHGARSLTIDDAVSCAEVLGIEIDRLFSSRSEESQAA
jgi:plasmid maintenance system antidote protein VapI